MINSTWFYLLNCVLLLSQKVLSAPLNDGEVVSEKNVNLDSSTITNTTTEKKIDKPTEDDDTKNAINMMSPSSLRLSENINRNVDNANAQGQSRKEKSVPDSYDRDVSMNSKDNKDMVNMGFNLATGASTYLGNIFNDVRERYNAIENPSTNSRYGLLLDVIRKSFSLGMAAADTAGDRISRIL